MTERATERGLEVSMGFEAEWVLDAGTGEEHVPATSGPAYGMDRLIEVSDYCRELLVAFRRPADRRAAAPSRIRARAVRAVRGPPTR